MKRLMLLSLLAFSSFGLVTNAQKISIPYPSALTNIAGCPDTGCGVVNRHLNVNHLDSFIRTAVAG